MAFEVTVSNEVNLSRFLARPLCRFFVINDHFEKK